MFHVKQIRTFIIVVLDTKSPNVTQHSLTLFFFKCSNKTKIVLKKNNKIKATK